VAQEPSLCTRCGLCCMGVIHPAAVLDEDEVVPAREIGLPVLDRPGRPGFALPCPMLVELKCTIFGRRPRVCSRYQCQLLQDYRSGLIDFEAAGAKVAYAHELARAVQDLLPATMSLPAARKLVNQGSSPTSSTEAPGLLELRLRVTALELYLDKNMRAEKDGRAIDMTPVDKE